ncbi:MAG: hypothetical protein ABSD89_03210 [Halobacteriota archaeon]|jgi:hypothetical protein
METFIYGHIVEISKVTLKVIGKASAMKLKKFQLLTSFALAKAPSGDPAGSPENIINWR